MKAIMRNYNGVYSIFVEVNGHRELVETTKIIAQASKRFAEIEKQISTFQ